MLQSRQGASDTRREGRGRGRGRYGRAPGEHPKCGSTLQYVHIVSFTLARTVVPLMNHAEPYSYLDNEGKASRLLGALYLSQIDLRCTPDMTVAIRLL